MLWIDLSDLIGGVDPPNEHSGLNVRMSTYSSHFVHHYPFPSTPRFTPVLQLTSSSCDLKLSSYQAECDSSLLNQQFYQALALFTRMHFLSSCIGVEFIGYSFSM